LQREQTITKGEDRSKVVGEGRIGAAPHPLTKLRKFARCRRSPVIVRLGEPMVVKFGIARSPRSDG
jgi:hypothetical protein